MLKINQPLMERHLSAARRISRVALGSPETPISSFTVRLRPDLHSMSVSSNCRSGHAVEWLFDIRSHSTPITTSSCNWAQAPRPVSGTSS